MPVTLGGNDRGQVELGSVLVRRSPQGCLGRGASRLEVPGVERRDGDEVGHVNDGAHHVLIHPDAVGQPGPTASTLAREGLASDETQGGLKIGNPLGAARLAPHTKTAEQVYVGEHAHQLVDAHASGDAGRRLGCVGEVLSAGRGVDTEPAAHLGQVNPHLCGVRAERVDHLVDGDALRVQHQEGKQLGVEGLALGDHGGTSRRSGPRLDGAEELEMGSGAGRPGREVCVQARIGVLDLRAHRGGDLGSELVQVPLGGGRDVQDVGVRTGDDGRAAVGLVLGCAGDHESVAQRAGGVAVLPPAVVAVGGHLDVVEFVGVAQQTGASFGFGRGEAVGDQVEAQGGDEQPAVAGEPDAEAADGLAVADHDHSVILLHEVTDDLRLHLRCGDPEHPVTGNPKEICHLRQLRHPVPGRDECRDREGSVDEDEPAVPEVAAEVLGAAVGGGDAVVGALLQGHAGGNDGGVQRRRVVEGVVVDAGGVEGDCFGCDADALQVHRARPGIDRDLSGQVAGEVGRVRGVASQADGAKLFEVDQPGGAGVVLTDGDHLRVRRSAAGLRPVIVDGEQPTPTVLAVSAPRRRQRAWLGELHRHRPGEQLEGHEVRQGIGVTHGRGQQLESLLDDRQGGQRRGPLGGDGLLDRDQFGWRHSDRSTGSASPELGTAALTEGGQQATGQDGSGAGESDQEPGGVGGRRLVDGRRGRRHLGRTGLAW